MNRRPKCSPFYPLHFSFLHPQMSPDRGRFRHEVRSRHADVLEILRQGVPDIGCAHAADHPRWLGLGLGSSRIHAVGGKHDKVEEAVNALTSLLLSSVVAAADDKQLEAGAVQLEEEADLICNDYNQYYVDSGLKVLPGTWVQNVSPETRFIEYVPRMAYTGTPNCAVSFTPKQKLLSARPSPPRTTKPT